MSNLSLHSVEAVIILDNKGERIYSKYYSSPNGDAADELKTNTKKQTQFESKLFKATFDQQTDIILFENHTVVYKQYSDCLIYVIGGISENEIMLYNVIQGLTGALEIILESDIDKVSLLESYDCVALTVDETVDDGIVLETDASAIAVRVTDPPTEDVNNIKIDLSERGLFNAFNFAKKNISQRLQQGF